MEIGVSVNALAHGHFVLPCRRMCVCFLKMFLIIYLKAYFTNYLTDTRQLCSYFNAFLMLIPHIQILVTTFHNFDIRERKKRCDMLDLSSAHIEQFTSIHAERVKLTPLNAMRQPTFALRVGSNPFTWAFSR